tara:strand:- start:3406 stop:3906 length:501 start_codon:yes stop_codon:yes gene_type:complete
MSHAINHNELILESINQNVILNRTLNFNPNTPTTYTNNFLAHIKLNTSTTYESQTLSINSAFLSTAPAQNGTSIDMLDKRNLYLQIRMVADSGLFGIYDTIYIYYSLDNITFRIGESITLIETGISTGNYEGIKRILDCGARYIRLYVKNRDSNATNFLVQYSRSN